MARILLALVGVLGAGLLAPQLPSSPNAVPGQAQAPPSAGAEAGPRDTTDSSYEIDATLVRAGVRVWFRTHPPFYERMVEGESEIIFLPKREGQVVQTSAFLEMKKNLAPVVAEARKEEKEKPSLLMTKEEGCTAPQKIEYKPGRPIEQICSVEPRSPEPAAETPAGNSAR